MFAILQKYEFSSKSQHRIRQFACLLSCLRYCKSTSFQANHNHARTDNTLHLVVCDTAKVRVFKQITTKSLVFGNKIVSLQNKGLGLWDTASDCISEGKGLINLLLFLVCFLMVGEFRSHWWYCKSTIFQVSHNC